MPLLILLICSSVSDETDRDKDENGGPVKKSRLIIQGDPHADSFYLAVGALMCGLHESGRIPNRNLPLRELVLDSLTEDTDTGK